MRQIATLPSLVPAPEARRIRARSERSELRDRPLPELVPAPEARRNSARSERRELRDHRQLTIRTPFRRGDGNGGEDRPTFPSPLPGACSIFRVQIPEFVRLTPGFIPSALRA